MATRVADMTWQILMSSMRFESNGLVWTTRLQNQARQATRHMGESLPLALSPGEKPIKPFIFVGPGEALEKLSGRLISQRG
jgi:hypothetical protein